MAHEASLFQPTLVASGDRSKCSALQFDPLGRSHHRSLVWLDGLGAATYLVGVLGVTFAGNVPLNNTLDTFDLATATDDETAKQRADYEGAWNRWHALRTAASVLSLTCTAIAALGDGE